jgi:hypothetical protein
VLILGRSTLGVESLLVGKPLICVQPPENKGWILPPYMQDYLSAMPDLQAQSSEELVQAWKILHQPETRQQIDALGSQIIDKYALSADGKSSARVAKLIDGLARQAKA